MMGLDRSASSQRGGQLGAVPLKRITKDGGEHLPTRITIGERGRTTLREEERRNDHQAGEREASKDGAASTTHELTF